MPLTIENKAVPKTTGYLINLEPEINHLVEYIIAKKKISKDQFFRESIYRNVNYFMQIEDKREEIEEFVEPSIIPPEEEAPKPKRRARKKKTTK